MDIHSSINHVIEPMAQTAPSEAHPDNECPPLLIVMNAGAGKRKSGTVRNELVHLFQQANQPYELLLCRHPRDLVALTKQAVEQARQRNGVVVAAGGDGTIRYVAQEVLAADLPFGVLPLGTFNYFARDNGLPQDAVAAADMLIAGLRADIERPVQVGLLNDQVFLVNASLGLYPQLLADREKFKQQHGRSRIVARLAGIISLVRRETRMLLRVEYASGQQSGEQVVPASTIFVGNNALQLQRVGLAPEAESVEHGEIAVVALPPLTVLERIGVALRGMFGLLGEAPNVSHFSCQQLIVAPLSRHLHSISVAMDGEGAKVRPPLVFRVSPRPLRLIAAQPQQSPTTGAET